MVKKQTYCCYILICVMVRSKQIVEFELICPWDNPQITKFVCSCNLLKINWSSSFWHLLLHEISRLYNSITCYFINFGTLNFGTLNLCGCFDSMLNIFLYYKVFFFWFVNTEILKFANFKGDWKKSRFCLGYRFRVCSRVSLKHLYFLGVERMNC